MVREQDDFYQALNGQWIDQAEIPADKPATGGFYDLLQTIEDQERDALADFEDGKTKTPAELANFVAFHRLTADWQKREADGVKPLQDELAPLKKLNSWTDFQKQEGTLINQAYTTPLALWVGPDSKNTAINELWLGGPDLILPDVTTYDDEEERERLLGVWSKMVVKLLEATGYSTDEAQTMTNQAIELDAQLAERESSNEELSDYWKNYHPTTLADLKKRLPDYDLGKVLTAVLPDQPDQVIVHDAKFWDQAADIYRPGNFDRFKSWMIIQAVLESAPFLTNDLRVLAGTYGRELSGAKEAANPAKAAFKQAHAFFASVVGLWYGEKFFGPKAKADVTSMVKSLIQVYQDRFDENDWLSPKTLTKAKIKLAALKIKVGYPDYIPPYLTERQVDTDASVLANIARFSQEAQAEHFKRWHQEPDERVWSMPADLVNAYYSPSFNQIVFPAAILQAPFYSLDQPSSANYGGIGTVIAHEITHAFDTNGARFDEHGNLKEWWQPEDFKHFEAQTKLIEDQFDGLPSAGATVNGHLTVSENVADLGGISAALTAAQRQPDFDARIFFENLAKIWRQKASDQFLELLAAIDVHAPAKLRVNVPVKNFDLFFETFGIQPGDGMWQDPKDRVQIW
ncbi:endopeptidase [Leuconostocaceae bacterium ESL0723]|nr:endopeptidase [Leuconostocaceae bacterium ESL0723]